MCHIPEIFKSKGFCLFLGLVLILISAPLLILNPIFSLSALALGVILFITSSMLFLYETTIGKNSWQNLSIFVIILSFLLWFIIAITEMKASDIVNIQNTYITIFIAIISVSFAAIAINSQQLIHLLKTTKKKAEPNDFPFFDIERFQGFIIINAFMIIFSIFVSVSTTIIPASASKFYFLYIPSFLFGMTTCMTIFLVFLLMGYLSAIVDRILNPGNYEERTPTAKTP